MSARKLYGRTALCIYGLIAVASQGDAILGLAGTLLHYALEVIELGLENLIEHLFHVSGHTAQMITAWIGLGVFLIIAWLAYRKAAARIGGLVAAWSSFLGRMNGLGLKPLVIPMGLFVSVCLILLFSF